MVTWGIISILIDYNYLPIHCKFYLDMPHHFKDYLALVHAIGKARNSSGHGVRMKLAIGGIGGNDDNRRGKSKDKLALTKD
jgi:hypothetical protein